MGTNTKVGLLKPVAGKAGNLNHSAASPGRTERSGLGKIMSKLLGRHSAKVQGASGGNVDRVKQGSVGYQGGNGIFKKLRKRITKAVNTLSLMFTSRKPEPSVFGSTKNIKAFIKAGGNVNMVNEYGNTGLFAASVEGDINAIKLLLDNGANIDYADELGETALIQALYWRKGLEAVHSLIERGANPNKKDCHDKTALHVATRFCRSEEIIRDLLTHGAEVNAKDKCGKTALHHTAENTWGLDLESINALFEFGGNLKIQKDDGRTRHCIARFSLKAPPLSKPFLNKMSVS